MKPAQLFPEIQDVPMSRRAERMGRWGWGGMAGIMYVFSDGAQAEVLAIPSCVWKVCRFHYSLSRLAEVAMFLHGGPRVRGKVFSLVSPGLNRAR